MFAKKVHWHICKKNGLEHSEKWFEHALEGAVENEEIKVLWGIYIQCNKQSDSGKTTRPNSYCQERTKGIIIDIAIPADVRVEEKEKEKVQKVSGFEKRDQKIVEIKKCRNCSCNDRGP